MQQRPYRPTERSSGQLYTVRDDPYANQHSNAPRRKSAARGGIQGPGGHKRHAAAYGTPRRRPPFPPIALIVVAACIVFIVVFCAVVCSCGARTTASTSTGTTAETLAETTVDNTEAATVVEETTSLATYVGGGLSLGDDGILTVVLDPGHGAEDEGTSGYGLIESDIVWTISSYCAAYLEQVDGVEVIITRGENENVSLQDRALVATEYETDIMVSLHVNYNEDDERINGTYIYYPTELTSYLLEETSLPAQTVAAYIMEELVSLGLTNNGIVDEPLHINLFDEEDAHYAYPDDDSGFSDYYGIIRWPRYYGIAAVLVEHAFLSNSSDAALLSDESFLQALGEADARGILEAFGFEIN